MQCHHCANAPRTITSEGSSPKAMMLVPSRAHSNQHCIACSCTRAPKPQVQHSWIPAAVGKTITWKFPCSEAFYRYAKGPTRCQSSLNRSQG